MSRTLARRRLLAVGLSIAMTTPIALFAGSPAHAADTTFKEFSFRDSGPRVKLTQRVLDVSPRTGYFNKKTRHAVRRFQDKRDFQVTGVVNERTWNALERRWENVQKARLRIDRKYHAIMRVARNQKGDPYVYGAAGPGAFDCSGLTMFVYRKAAGISMQHSASAQSRRGDRIPRKAARPGDLVFMYDGGGVYHAAIYAGKGDIIHASRPGTNVKRDPIWTSRYFIVRVLPKR
ncbi:MAG TPA: NlpC/P60 family protein [Actinomycetes bacterium]|nr:NlpC/P60 family protein [Actinomycetes bacterium]